MLRSVLIFAGAVAGLALLVYLLRGTWRYRRRDFIFRVPTGYGPAGDAAGSAFYDAVIPAFAQDGFRMVASGGHTSSFEHRYQPGWTIVMALVLFPFGLLFLLARGRESVTVVLAGGVIEVHGYATVPMADFLVAAAHHAAVEGRAALSGPPHA